MNRLTILGDIAGRVSVSSTGNPRVTAASVVVSTADEGSIRTALGTTTPKWGRCSLSDASRVIALLHSRSVAVGVMSINKDTDSWRKFAEDAKVLQDAIVRQSKQPAGWVKPSNLLAFLLLGGSAAMATGHALRVDPSMRIVGEDGLQLIHRRLVFDSDISGSENVDVFKSFWEKKSIPRSRLAELGVRMAHVDVSVSTEQEEPLLLLADYAAGIAHSMLLPEPGRLPLPVPHEQAKTLARELHRAGKLVVDNRNFENSYDEIFGSVMAYAREQSAGQPP